MGRASIDIDVRTQLAATDGPKDSVRQAGQIRSARLESLRAIAALAVLEGHVFGASVNYGPASFNSLWHRVLFGGGFGVFLFFALSGYLLYLPFARRDFADGRRTDLGTYARNRALRILPLYYVVAITYLAVFRPTFGTWLRFLTFTETFSTSSVGRVDGPMWSLVVELLFYALLPLLALGLARAARGSLTRAGAILLMLGALAGAYRWIAFLGATHPSRLVQYNLPATFFFFIPGMLLALAKVRAVTKPRVAFWGIVGRSSLWIAASALCWGIVFWRYQWDLLAGLASFLLVGACVLPLRRSFVFKALDWRPLAVLGIASYSLYLWHLPIVDALGARSLGGYPGHLVIATVVCVTVALASYRIVESPFLRLRHRWGDTAASQPLPSTSKSAAPKEPAAARSR